VNDCRAKLPGNLPGPVATVVIDNDEFDGAAAFALITFSGSAKGGNGLGEKPFFVVSGNDDGK
jgi:hypothetical protein